jgi:hypothetical protein
MRHTVTGATAIALVIGVIGVMTGIASAIAQAAAG